MIRCMLFCSILMVSVYGKAQPKTFVKAGENFITLNGERFHNEKIILKPHASGYDNLWFDNGKQKFTDIDLIGKYDDRAVDFQLRFPGQNGKYTIEDNRNAGGSQNNDNNCSFLMKDKNTYGDGLGAEPGSIKIIVTRYDKPGGLIEGTIDGTLMTGIRNNTAITISGNFSVIRDKDKKGF